MTPNVHHLSFCNVRSLKEDLSRKSPIARTSMEFQGHKRKGLLYQAKPMLFLPYKL